MHFTIHCLDKPGGVQERLDNYEAHKGVSRNSARAHSDLRPATRPRP